MRRLKRVPITRFKLGEKVQVIAKHKVHVGLIGTIKRILPDEKSRYFILFSNGYGWAYCSEAELGPVEGVGE